MIAAKDVVVSVVPATPGWYVGFLVKAGKEGGESWDAFFSFDPIIAWEIERHDTPYHPKAGRIPGESFVTHSVQPITLDGSMNNDVDTWVIKRPDGRIEIPHDATCENEADAIKRLLRIEEILLLHASPAVDAL